MKGVASHKVEGGKLVEAEVEVKEGVIVGINVTGDFFLHPEESISRLEESLRGTRVSEANKVVESFFQSGVKAYGVDAESVKKVILEASK